MTGDSFTKFQLPSAFAAQNTTNRNIIQKGDLNSQGGSSNLATFAGGFPDITMTPVNAGGIPPSGADMNGILYILSTLLFNAQNGVGINEYNATSQTQNGGYPQNAILWYTLNGVPTLIRSLADNNTYSPADAIYGLNGTSPAWENLLKIPSYLPDWSSTPVQYLNQYVMVNTNQTYYFTIPYDCWFVFWATSIDWGRLRFGFRNANGSDTNLFTEVWGRDSGGTLSLNILCKQGDILYLRPTTYPADCRYSYVPFRS